MFKSRRMKIVKIILFSAIIITITSICIVFIDKESNKIVAIECGPRSTFVIRANGSVDGVGQTFGADSWSNIKQISISGDHVVGLKTDGTVIAAGNNEFGQCNVQELNNVVQVVSLNNITYALRNNGEVVSIGKKHDLSLIHISEPTRPY